VLFRSSHMADFRTPNIPKKIRKRSLQLMKEGSAGYFDGSTVASRNCCGVGGILKINDHKSIKWLINCGPGTNTKDELMGV